MNPIGIAMIALIVSAIIYAVWTRKGKTGTPSGNGAKGKDDGKGKSHSEHEYKNR